MNFNPVRKINCTFVRLRNEMALLVCFYSLLTLIFNTPTTRMIVWPSAHICTFPLGLHHQPGHLQLTQGDFEHHYPFQSFSHSAGSHKRWKHKSLLAWQKVHWSLHSAIRPLGLQFVRLTKHLPFSFLCQPINLSLAFSFYCPKNCIKNWKS